MATDGAPLLTLEVATPVGLVLRTKTDSVQAPSVNGEFGVLPGHLPLLAALKAGVLKYREDNKERVAAIAPGFIEAGPEKVLLLTESFYNPADIDKAATEKALTGYEEKIAKFTGEYDSPEYAELVYDRDLAQAKLDAIALAS